MDDAIDRIATRTVRAAGRVALEAGIASIEKLLKDKPAIATPYAAAYYRKGLADAKAELAKLLATTVE